MKLGVLVALVAGCGAESRPAEPFAMDRCELATLRLVTFGDAAACAAGVPAEGTDLPAPVDDVTWATDGGAPPVLRVPESGPVTIVAFCADADGVVRQWGCDDDSDGDLDVHLLEACTTSEGACDPDRRGGHAWTGSGGPSCVRDCACAEPDNPPPAQAASVSASRH